MTTEGSIVEHQLPPPETPAGRLVVRYLQKSQGGATASQILEYLRAELQTPSDLGGIVESILENGTAMGFLERKGSHYLNWMARETSRRQRRRRSCCRRRRRRRIRRRRSRCCRRRRRRRC